MSNTDSAFIKVFQHHSDHGTPAPMMTGGVRVRKDGILVAGNRNTVSQVVASATSPVSWTTHASANQALSDSLESHEAPSTGNASRVQREAGSQRSTKKVSWRDPAHPPVPAPHLDVSRFGRPEPVVQRKIRSQLRPAWEVDRFQWPEICEQLQREWSSALTSIVKSVVREAWRGSNIVGVTQFARAEGATTLALCLARIAASFHIKVALVDGHAQHPDIGGSLGLRFDHGWEQIGGGTALEEAAIRSLDDRLVRFFRSPTLRQNPSRIQPIQRAS